MPTGGKTKTRAKPGHEHDKQLSPFKYLILPEVRYVYSLPLENVFDWTCSWFIYTRWHDLKISTWITKNLHLNLSKNAKEICQIWGFFLVGQKRCGAWWPGLCGFCKWTASRYLWLQMGPGRPTVAVFWEGKWGPVISGKSRFWCVVFYRGFHHLRKRGTNCTSSWILWHAIWPDCYSD